MENVLETFKHEVKRHHLKVDETLGRFKHPYSRISTHRGLIHLLGTMQGALVRLEHAHREHLDHAARKQAYAVVDRCTKRLLYLEAELPHGDSLGLMVKRIAIHTRHYLDQLRHGGILRR